MPELKEMSLTAFRRGTKEEITARLEEPCIATADGEGVFVVMTMEQYYAKLLQIPQIPQRECRRIDGVMWYRFK